MSISTSPSSSKGRFGHLAYKGRKEEEREGGREEGRKGGREGGREGVQY